jgi:hypothetical protein
MLAIWGFLPFCSWARDPNIRLRTINAKAETITTTPAFRSKAANSWRFSGFCVFFESCWRTLSGAAIVARDLTSRTKKRSREYR